MRSYFRRNAPLFYAFAVMLILYIPWLNRGYLNWEWPHVLAGEALAYPEKIELLDSYWSTGQANPLGYPLFNALLQRIVPWTDAPWLWRMPSLFGCGLILTWGWLTREELKEVSRNNFFAWGLLLVTHPMIAAFSTHATSDLIPVGVLYISFWQLQQFSKTEKFGHLLISAVLFGLSSTIRYIAPYFAGYAIYVFLTSHLKFNRKVFHVIAFGLIGVLILVSEIAWKFSMFDVLISTRLLDYRFYFLEISNWFFAFLRYLSFMGLFCGVIPLFLAWKNFRVMSFQLKNIIYVMTVVLFALFSTKSIAEGELDFGGGISLSSQSFKIILFLGFVNFVLMIYSVVNCGEKQNRFMSAWVSGVVPYLVLISASRPTQRYLIYAIPIFLFVLVERLSQISRSARLASLSFSLVLFASVSIWGMSYLRAQGNASEDMAVWVEENNLISETSAGAIWPHAGQHFWGVEPTDLRYEIIAVTPENESQVKERVLHREPMKVLGRVTRVYILREVAEP